MADSGLAALRTFGSGADPRRILSLLIKSAEYCDAGGRAMLRFRQMKSHQKFASVHANVHNHFNL
jgi:hypothetical protein